MIKIYRNITEKESNVEIVCISLTPGETAPRAASESLLETGLSEVSLLCPSSLPAITPWPLEDSLCPSDCALRYREQGWESL